jgi:chaperonin GroES
MVNAIPTEDRVILKLTHEDKVTDSGFVIPKNAQEIPNQGEVVAVGPGRYTSAGIYILMDVRVGDVVVFNKEMAYGIKLDGEDYVTVPSLGILAIVDSPHF